MRIKRVMWRRYFQLPWWPQGLLIIGLALVMRLAVWASVNQTPLAYWHRWDQSDMAAYHAQAVRLAEGDWLAREAYHPYHTWMWRHEAESWRGWHPAAQFYQPPLYSYLLAALMHLELDAVAAMRGIQVVLGVLNCLLLARLGAGLFGRTAGMIAGILGAIYGPMLIVESQLLRDTLILSLTLGALNLYYGWLWRWKGARGGEALAERFSWRREGLLFGCGLVLGIQMMAHESALLIAALLMGWTASELVRQASGRQARLRRRMIVAAGVVFVAGLSLGYGPMLVRNGMVGMSPMPKYFASYVTVGVANWAPDAVRPFSNYIAPGGIERLMREAEGSVMRLLWGIVESWKGQWTGWLELWATRLGALGLGIEHGDNLSYEFFRYKVPILAFAIDFRVVLPLAAAGMGQWAIWGRRRRALRGRVAGLLWGFGLLMVGMISLVYPFGRYRLILLPLLIPFGAWALVGMGRAARQSRIGTVAGWLAAIGLVGLMQWGIHQLPVYRELGGMRRADFLMTSRLLAQAGLFEAAAKELEGGLRFLPGDRAMIAEYHLNRGLAYLREGKTSEAMEQVKQAVAINPEHEAGRKLLESLRQRSGVGP